MQSDLTFSSVWALKCSAALQQRLSTKPWSRWNRNKLLFHSWEMSARKFMLRGHKCSQHRRGWNDRCFRLVKNVKSKISMPEKRQKLHFSTFHSRPVETFTRTKHESQKNEIRSLLNVCQSVYLPHPAPPLFISLLCFPLCCVAKMKSSERRFVKRFTWKNLLPAQLHLF